MEKDSVVLFREQLEASKVTSDKSENIYAWLRLIRDRRWSRRQKHQLLDAFQSPENIYQASSASCSKVVTGRVHKGVLTSALNVKKAVQQDVDWLKAELAHCITFDSPHYPELLRQIVDPPLALFAIGDVLLLNEPKLAIDGSRRPTPIGGKLARQFAQELSDLGLVITSGMALGIDGLAHEGALDGGNPTVAVMGCGLDSIYPARNRGLFDKIRRQGLLISEYPPGVKASKYTFPERNRIVSGVSLGVVIVEAAAKSGTMITARLAIEQNRELMVLPGSAVSAQYEGSHSLLRDGATLVSNSEDVLFSLKDQISFFGLNYEKECVGNGEDGAFCQDSLVAQEVGGEEQVQLGIAPQLNPVLELIGAESVSVDELIILSGLTSAKVSSMLLMLELEGKVAISDDGGYINIS